MNGMITYLLVYDVMFLGSGEDIITAQLFSDNI